jgi:RNA recognition motif-containing protein
MQHYELAGLKMKVSLDSTGSLTNAFSDKRRKVESSESVKVSYHQTLNWSPDQNPVKKRKHSESPNSYLDSDSNSPPKSRKQLPQKLTQIAKKLQVNTEIQPHLFVSNIQWQIDEAKLEEVFSLAGKLKKVHLFRKGRERIGQSLGLAEIEYFNEFDALNAISMFDGRNLAGRALFVRFDKKLKTTNGLPKGLESIGKRIDIDRLLDSSSNSSNSPSPSAAIMPLMSQEVLSSQHCSQTCVATVMQSYQSQFVCTNVTEMLDENRFFYANLFGQSSLPQ